MPDTWDYYLCDLNDAAASIYLNLGLAETAPDREKPNLLWIWVEMKWPADNGLSTDSEFDTLCEIENRMTATIKDKFEAVYCGRITTDGRREFYFYAARSDQLQQAVEEALAKFKGYEF